MLSFSQRVIDKARTKLNFSPAWGAVGDWSGNLGSMSMLARNLYYVRIPTSGGLSATPAIMRGPYNSPTPLAINQLVDIGYDTDGIAYIKGNNFGAMVAAGGNPVPAPPPAAGVVTPQSQIATLRPFQDLVQPSLKVNLDGWKVIVAGVRYNFPGYNQFDLSGFVPGSGHCIVGVFIQNDNITPIAYASTAIPLNDALGDADVQDVISQAYAANHAYTPVWAYAVATGATAITDADTYEDMRQFIKVGLG